MFTSNKFKLLKIIVYLEKYFLKYFLGKIFSKFCVFYIERKKTHFCLGGLFKEMNLQCSLNSHCSQMEFGLSDPICFW